MPLPAHRRTRAQSHHGPLRRRLGPAGASPGNRGELRDKCERLRTTGGTAYDSGRGNSESMGGAPIDYRRNVCRHGFAGLLLQRKTARSLTLGTNP